VGPFQHGTIQGRFLNASNETRYVSVWACSTIIVTTMVCHVALPAVGSLAQMGIYNANTNALLARTNSFTPVAGMNIVPLAVPTSLTLVTGTPYYFALGFNNISNNRILAFAGVWTGGVLSPPGVQPSFASTSGLPLPATATGFGNQRRDPPWIMAYGSAGAATAGNYANVTVAVAGPTTITAPPTGQELLVKVDTATIGAASTINLPATPNTDSLIDVKDSTGTAAANPITVSGNGNTIDGAASLVINVNYGNVRLWWNGTQWRVV
jgi:hypothetical protein